MLAFCAGCEQRADTPQPFTDTAQYYLQCIELSNCTLCGDGRAQTRLPSPRRGRGSSPVVEACQQVLRAGVVRGWHDITIRGWHDITIHGYGNPEGESKQSLQSGGNGGSNETTYTQWSRTG